MDYQDVPAEEILAALGRAFPDLIFIIDRDGRYVAALGGKDSSKYHDPSTLPRLAGLTFTDVMPPDLAARMLEAVRRTLAEDKVTTITYSLNEAEIPGYRDQPGPKTTQWFEARLSPIRQQGSTPDGIVALVYNITERLRIEARLEELALTDELTGLPNRRAFLERARQITAACERMHQPVTLAMIDIDNFKAINDRYGHAGGDAVLQQFAELAARHLRDADLLARIGGEEFALLLPNTGLAAARIAAERLLRAVRGQQFECGNTVIRASVSIGIAEHMPKGKHALDSLLCTADSALYAAKQHGRDRVAVASD